MKLLASWTDEYSDHESIQLLKDFAYHHARLGGTEGQRIISLLDNNDFASLCDWTLTYGDQARPIELYHCRQALGFFTKSEYLDIGVDKRAVALSKFLEAETMCRETNIIFKRWARGDLCFPRGVDSIFYAASRKIARVLGDVPKISDLRLRFGPGATTLTKRRHASARSKLSTCMACSEDLLPILQDVLQELPGWISMFPETAPGVAQVPVRVTNGKLGFVPKSAKTFRTTVTEPVLNGMLQLGIGEHMEKALAANGLNLRDQSLNQRLAREGSLTGTLATLDLSSASDTISKELVYHLLPYDWAVLLDRCRSSKIDVDGCELIQQKFSSMGNGYTFPLESLIFHSLVEACCDPSETFTVYGDDIICPSHRVPLVVQVLTCAGFVVNMTKSYWTGPFRESCGADFFRGFDIRPYYQKKLVSPATLFVLHNYYVRTLQFDEAEMVKKLIHPSLHITGPDGYGDGHLIGEWSPKPHKRGIGWAGSLFSTFTLKKRRDLRPSLPGDGVLPSYTVYLRDSYPLRDVSHARMDVLHGTLYSDIREAVSRDSVLPGARGYKKISIYTLTG